ncbi:hypothetical protein LSH36_55g09006 [Paralvinella palmiformis]|uniref:Rho-GAP domain-containing protein n=1 Tax=Paralvinella palmiformis TaxID=53620 RepID=A0AAD9K5U4_9ANNE|nr:hypothetical protein LSH36_55g09006 [Paralvinella palmiformis]
MMCTKEIEQNRLKDMNLYTEMAKDVEVDTILQRGLSPPGSCVVKLHNRKKFKTAAITNAIMKYFRDLPEPIITRNLTPHLLRAASKYIDNCLILLLLLIIISILINVGEMTETKIVIRIGNSIYRFGQFTRHNNAAG